MKIISYNINGIRAAMSKGLVDWLKATDADVVCFQEVKALEEQVDLEPFKALGYSIYWHAAEKKGYSGVAILSRIRPDHVEAGMGLERYDREGRVLRLDLGNLSVLSAYFPSGSSGEERQAFKMDFLRDFQSFTDSLKKDRPELVISGDYNICHRPIDIHDPVRNKNSSGFLPEERSWMDGFLESGFVDSFRAFDESPDKYSWWSYRAGARKRNRGWRIDYHMVSENVKDRMRNAAILSEAVHSDHCPILLDIV